MKGKLIVFEGIGGCGKDTQSRKFEDYLKGKKIDVLSTREHTRDTPPGALIEKIIKKQDTQIDPLALQLLYVCDRRNHCEGVIKPNLDGGRVVIANRYYPTTVAYCPDEWRKIILKLNQEVVVKPDLVVIVDLDPEEAVKRINVRKDADIFDEVESLKKCRKGYKWYAKHSGDKVVWIDGSGTREEVFERIISSELIEIL